MKRIVLTTLALTLLSGTSALAQANTIRQMREQRAAAERSAPPEAAPVRREDAPRAQPRPERTESASPQGEGRSRDRGDRPDRPDRPDRSQMQAQAQAQRQSQQLQQRPGSLASTVQQVQQARARAEASRLAAPTNGGRPDRDRNDRGDRNDRDRNDRNDRDRNGRYDNRYDNRAGDRDGWNGSGQRPGQGSWQRQGQDGRPVIRPQDRHDRDYNRPRYDQRRYPRYVTPRARYHWYGPAYRPPVGFYYNSWQFGQTLPWNWYTPNYYLNDWWDYGLPMPPAGFEWVRVGYDVVLVDVFTGRIHQVIRHLFW